MKDAFSPGNSKKLVSIPLKITAIYLAAGGLWILLSDKILQLLVSDPRALTHIAIIKGWLYVAATGWMLYALIARGISQIQRSEREAGITEVKYRELVESANSIIMRWDVAGRITYFNEYAQDFFGYSQDEILGRHVVGAIVPEEDGSGRNLKAMIEEIGSDPERYAKNENENMTRAGERVWISWTNKPIRDEHGRIVEVLSIGNDMTELKRAGETLRRFELLVSHSRDIIFFIRRDDGRILEANEAATKAYGYDREQLLNMTIHQLRTPETLGEVPDQLAKADSEGILLETVHRRCDGSTFPVEISSRGETIGGVRTLISVVRDITERKRAEEELRISEARFRKLFEESPIGIAFLGQQREIFLTNQSYRDFLGYTEPEIIERGPAGLLHPQDWEPSMALSTKMRSGEIPLFHMEQRFVRKDGTVVWADTQITVVRDEDGRLIHTIGWVQDITARKRAEEEIRDREQKYRVLFETAHDGIFLQEPAGKFVDCNEDGSRMLGLSKEDIIGRSPADVSPERQPDGRLSSEVAEEKLRAACAGHPQHFEFQVLHAEGGTLDVEVSLNRFETGGSFLLQSIIRDITERKLAERELATSRSLLKSIFEAVPDLLIVVDDKYRIVFSNYRGHDQVFQTDPAKAGTCYGRFKLLEEPCEDCSTRPVFESGCVVEREMLNPADGRTREVRAFPILDASGKVVLAVEYVRDITDRKRAEVTRSLNESRLETLLRLNRMTGSTLHEIAEFAMEEAVRLTQSTIGYVAFMNEDETILTMHAWSRAAMRECQIDDKPLEYPVETTGLWGEAVRQRRPMITNHYRASNPHKRGTPQGHVEVLRHMNVPIIDGDRIVIVAGVGNKPADYDEADVRQLTLLMTGMWHIVQRKRDEEALRASEEKYRQVVENAHDSIFIAQDGLIKFPNPQLSVISGYSPAELTRKPFLEFVHPDDRELVGSTYQRRLRGEEAAPTYSFRAMNKQGDTVWVEVSSVLITWEGRPASLNFMRDITLQKKLESQLVHAQKMESVGRLAGGVAHDFNNKIQAIFGYTSLALNEVHPDSILYQWLQEVEKAAQQSADLTRQLLAFARRQTIRLQVLDLNETISAMLNMLRRIVGEDIDLHWDGGRGLWSVKMDPAQIDQIVVNLVVNSRDAISGAGHISLKTQNTGLDDAFCSAHAGAVPGDYVLLSVSDNGLGMSKETMENIFEPFFTTKELGKGTGLGLATVYGIVKQNMGFIDVQSELGRGTAFHIYLPRTHVPVSEEQSSQEPDENLRGTETVLLVEDEESVLQLSKRILEQLGYVVLAADNPLDALELARSHSGRIDLLLTDVIMPGMNGKEFTEKLSAIKAGFRAIFMSGYTDDVIAQHGVLDEGVHFLQKPFSVQSLAAKVREVLDA